MGAPTELPVKNSRGDVATRRGLRARDKRCDDTGERQTCRNKLRHNAGQNTTQV